jgi:hypothetical protein
MTAAARKAPQIFWKLPFELKIRQTFLQVATNPIVPARRGKQARRAGITVGNQRPIEAR